MVRGAASRNDLCRLSVELQRGSLPPLAGVHGLPVRRLLVAQADEELVDDALHLRHIPVERLNTRVFSEAVFEYFSEVHNNMDQVAEWGEKLANVAEECITEYNSRGERNRDADKEDNMEAETPATDRH